MTFPYLKQKYQIPGFYIDVPYEKNQDSISYVADQLRELKKFLEDVGGKKISEQSVQRAVANSNEAASYYSSQLALRKDHDPVTSLTNELYAIFMCHLLAGSEESLKYTKMLLEDVKKAPKGEGLHILWMHMMPFLQEPVKDVFNYSQNVHIRACDFVADGFQRMQASDPYEALAEKMVNCIYNGSVKQRILSFRTRSRDLVRKLKILWKMQDFQPWSWTVTAVTRPIPVTARYPHDFRHIWKCCQKVRRKNGHDTLRL